MHRCLALVLLLSAGIAYPAPVPKQPARRMSPGSGTLSPTEQRALAEALLSMTDTVVRNYVRPVSDEDLTYAALAGLYRRARRSVPEDLKARIGKTEFGEARLALVGKTLQELSSAKTLVGRDLVLIAAQEMIATLDPHSQLVVPGEKNATPRMETEGEGPGLELEEYMGAGPLKVAVVEPGSSAQRAGIKPGDLVIAVEGKPVEKLTAGEIQELMGQTSGPRDFVLPVVEEMPPLRLVLQRKGGPQEVKIDRRPYAIETVLGVRRFPDGSWDYFVDRENRLAQVRLAKLARGTAEQLQDVLRRLERERMRGLILDLRWCPGGYLNEAVDCARLFLGEATIATVKPREGEPNVFNSLGEGPFRSLPLVVLINEQTSGGAELIACALQDHRRAILSGQRSRGKASVQTPIHLSHPHAPSGIGLKLTTGIFLRPSGKNLHRFTDSKWSDDWGARPDPGQEMRVSTDLSESLKEGWELMTLRPGTSMERLKLDDPTADPQRQAALKTLRDLVNTTEKGKQAQPPGPPMQAR